MRGFQTLGRMRAVLCILLLPLMSLGQQEAEKAFEQLMSHYQTTPQGACRVTLLTCDSDSILTGYTFYAEGGRFLIEQDNGHIYYSEGEYLVVVNEGAKTLVIGPANTLDLRPQPFDMKQLEGAKLSLTKTEDLSTLTMIVTEGEAVKVSLTYRTDDLKILSYRIEKVKPLANASMIDPNCAEMQLRWLNTGFPSDTHLARFVTIRGKKVTPSNAYADFDFSNQLTSIEK